MNARFARGFGAAFFYVLATQAAHADLTAADVWADWQDYLTSTGYSVSGDASGSGGVLTVSDVSIEMPLAEEEGTVTITMGTLTFSENGDGTVDIAVPDNIPMNFATVDETGKPVTGALAFSHNDSSMTASGDRGDVTYDYSSALAKMELASLSIADEPMPENMLSVLLTIENVNSSTRTLTGDLRTYSQQLTADAVRYDIGFDDPESDDMGSFKGAIADVRTEGTGAMPPGMDPDDFDAALENGLAFDGTLTYGSGSSDFQGVGDGESFAFASTSQGGRFSFTMDADHLGYDLEQKQIGVSMQADELPVPVEISAAVSGFNLSIPVRESDEDQDFAIGLNLGDFTMSEVLWSMIDPAAQLPRDPANVVLDAVGKGKLLFNLLDPEEAAMMQIGATPPAEISALTINKLLVSLVGASLSGTGDFTFDNDDTTTMNGYPRPAGYIDLTMVGANALLEKLSGMGLVANEEAMGARLMMGLLAVPGDAPDTLKSRIEINDQGHIIANGQRIK
ncbi:DUF2125 domain-containing protein [Sedimentitalea sp. XS_ASV28]|uniref:DUF2125 domain-containing protein n=1 Tax=Sedimentitalea sp. XS_ASV28 TaxID=3241296 RepID=UPI003512BAC9